MIEPQQIAVANPDTDLERHPGLKRLAAAVLEKIPHDQIERIYLFTPIRRGGREWGTVVVTHSPDDGDRRRVFHARYWVETRGRDRGRGRAEVAEVGAGPLGIVQEVLDGVQQRAGDDTPPIEIDPAAWFPPGEAA